MHIIRMQFHPAPGPKGVIWRVHFVGRQRGLPERDRTPGSDSYYATSHLFIHVNGFPSYFLGADMDPALKDS